MNCVKWSVKLTCKKSIRIKKIKDIEVHLSLHNEENPKCLLFWFFGLEFGNERLKNTDIILYKPPNYLSKIKIFLSYCYDFLTNGRTKSRRFWAVYSRTLRPLWARTRHRKNADCSSRGQIYRLVIRSWVPKEAVDKSLALSSLVKCMLPQFGQIQECEPAKILVHDRIKDNSFFSKF